LKDQDKKDLLRLFHQQYGACSVLKTNPAEHSHGFYDSFDVDEVEAEIGPTRFKKLIDFVIARKSSLVSNGHRVWPHDHKEVHKQGAEVHCVRASDLEAFLSGGN
jgi:hypothetical protein